MDDPYPQVVALIAAATSCFFTLAESALAHYSPPRLLDLARKGEGEEACQSFIASDEDSGVLNAVHERFEVEIKELPEQIDTSTYMPA